MIPFALAVLLALTGTPPQDPSAPTRSAAGPCPIAEADSFARTADAPVPIGGGPMYFAARQRRYLDLLRGPQGQRLQYRRRGSTKGPDETILDMYEVTYEGLEKPIVLFLDGYHYTEPKAPAGFTCGGPLVIGMPPPDPFRAQPQLRSFAVEQGAARDFGEIPLGADSARPNALLFDHLRLVARASRAAAASGSSLNPNALSRELSSPRMVIVALPQQCQGRTIAPVSIEIAGSQGPPLQQLGPEMRGVDIASAVPGFSAPEGSMAAAYAAPMPRGNEQVVITYPEACTGGGTQVRLPVRYTPARPLDTPPATLPEGETPPEGAVYLQVVIDPAGTFQKADYIGGPAHLVKAAIEAIASWKVEPPRINGAPYITPVVLQVRFRDQ